MPALPLPLNRCSHRYEEASKSGLAAVELEPGAPLALESGAYNVVCILDGIVYVAIEDDDLVLTPGDELTIEPGQRRRAWNAGDEPARVVVHERALAIQA